MVILNHAVLGTSFEVVIDMAFGIRTPDTDTWVPNVTFPRATQYVTQSSLY